VIFFNSHPAIPGVILFSRIYLDPALLVFLKCLFLYFTLFYVFAFFAFRPRNTGAETSGPAKSVKIRVQDVLSA